MATSVGLRERPRPTALSSVVKTLTSESSLDRKKSKVGMATRGVAATAKRTSDLFRRFDEGKL